MYIRAFMELGGKVQQQQQQQVQLYLPCLRHIHEVRCTLYQRWAAGEALPGTTAWDQKLRA